MLAKNTSQDAATDWYFLVEVASFLSVLQPTEYTNFVQSRRTFAFFIENFCKCLTLLTQRYSRCLCKNSKNRFKEQHQAQKNMTHHYRLTFFSFPPHNSKYMSDSTKRLRQYSQFAQGKKKLSLLVVWSLQINIYICNRQYL